MWGRKPKGAGRRAIPPAEEIIATSMLLGEEAPIICSCCLGTRRSSGLFGIKSTCGQCDGVGYELVGRKTRDALGFDVNCKNEDVIIAILRRKIERGLHDDRP